jgi:hypothetical protein
VEMKIPGPGTVTMSYQPADGGSVQTLEVRHRALHDPRIPGRSRPYSYDPVNPTRLGMRKVCNEQTGDARGN